MFSARLSGEKGASRPLSYGRGSKEPPRGPQGVEWEGLMEAGRFLMPNTEGTLRICGIGSLRLPGL